MAPAVVDLCAELAIPPRQIRRFRCGFFFASCPRLKLEGLSSREAPLKAKHRGPSTVSSSIFPAANIITTMSNLAVKALASCYNKLLGEAVPMICFALPCGSVKNNMTHVALRGRGTTSAYNCFQLQVCSSNLKTFASVERGSTETTRVQHRSSMFGDTHANGGIK